MDVMRERGGHETMAISFMHVLTQPFPGRLPSALHEGSRDRGMSLLRGDGLGEGGGGDDGWHRARDNKLKTVTNMHA